MVRLLRLCVEYGQNEILNIKHNLPLGVTPTVDIIRSYLSDQQTERSLMMVNEIPVSRTDLGYYDKKCGVITQ